MNRPPGRWRKVGLSPEPTQWADRQSAVRLRERRIELTDEEREYVALVLEHVEDPTVRRGFHLGRRPDRRYAELYLAACFLADGGTPLGRKELARRTGCSRKVAWAALRHGKAAVARALDEIRRERLI